MKHRPSGPGTRRLPSQREHPCDCPSQNPLAPPSRDLLSVLYQRVHLQRVPAQELLAHGLHGRGLKAAFQGPEHAEGRIAMLFLNIPFCMRQCLFASVTGHHPGLQPHAEVSGGPPGRGGPLRGFCDREGCPGPRITWGGGSPTLVTEARLRPPDGRASTIVIGSLAPVFHGDRLREGSRPGPGASSRAGRHRLSFGNTGL